MAIDDAAQIMLPWPFCEHIIQRWPQAALYVRQTVAIPFSVFHSRLGQSL
jgi:hypothetical protein